MQPSTTRYSPLLSSPAQPSTAKLQPRTSFSLTLFHPNPIFLFKNRLVYFVLFFFYICCFYEQKGWKGICIKPEEKMLISNNKRWNDFEYHFWNWHPFCFFLTTPPCLLPLVMEKQPKLRDPQRWICLSKFTTLSFTKLSEKYKSPNIFCKEDMSPESTKEVWLLIFLWQAKFYSWDAASLESHIATIKIKKLGLPERGSFGDLYLSWMPFSVELLLMLVFVRDGDTAEKSAKFGPVGAWFCQVRLDSIAASLFVLNWLSWQIVSDDKIQITILILRRGALSR